MIELDETDPRMVFAMNKLNHRLNSIRSLGLSQRTIEKMYEIVKDVRDEFKREHGYEFPRLSLFLLPSIPIVTFFRADLTTEEIQNKMLVLIHNIQLVGYPINAPELAQAILGAWPHYRPEVERHTTGLSDKIH
jgi:hypothetical protein